VFGRKLTDGEQSAGHWRTRGEIAPHRIHGDPRQS
jgi:hypothetical protein